MMKAKMKVKIASFLESVIFSKSSLSNIGTLFFYQIEPSKNGLSLILPSSTQCLMWVR